MNSEFLSEAQLSALGFAACGEHVLVHPSCVIVGADHIELGSHVRIDPFCVLTATGGRLRVGSYVHISSHVAIAAAADISLGDFVAVSHGAKVLAASDDFRSGGIAGPMVSDEFRSVDVRPIAIGRHCIIGAGSVLLPGAAMGEGATLGALSVAKSPLSPWSVFAGTPARLLGQRDQREILAAEARLRAQRKF